MKIQKPFPKLLDKLKNKNSFLLALLLFLCLAVTVSVSRNKTGTKTHEKNNVEISGKKVIIYADNGNTIKLVDKDTGDTNAVDYTYETFLNDIGVHKVTVLFWEGGGTYLINQKTGSMILVPPAPIEISNNKKYIATAMSADSYVFSGIKIYRVYPERIEQEFEKADYNFKSAGWQASNVFAIQRNNKLEYIKKQEDTWTVVKTEE